MEKQLAQLPREHIFLTMIYPAQTFIFLLLSVLLVEVLASTPPPKQPAQPPSNAESLIFKSPLARQYLVPEHLPGLTFRIQRSYAGRLDVPTNGVLSSKIFFWLVPADDARGSKDLTIWLNGDACSGLAGAFYGTGPITIKPGAAPTKNPYSWTRHTNMLYLDLPLGIGFSRPGKATLKSSQEVGGLVFNFLTAFLKVFTEMHGNQMYLVGHAYAASFISYAADRIYAQQAQLALQLQGILLVNGAIAKTEYQQHIPVADYVTTNNETFQFDATLLKQLKATDQACGLTEYMTMNLVYPPKGPFQPVTKALNTTDPSQFRDECLIFYQMFLGSPPNMNLWNILDTAGPDPNYARLVYPRRADVQSAFHVAGNPRWEACGNLNNVFPHGDASPPPSERVLPNVIQRSKRTVIAHGALDATLPVNGVKLAIQSMTWADMQGFQKPITSNFLVNRKSSGKYHTERGLTFVELSQSGSIIPHDQPQAAFTLLEYLLGHRPTP